MSTQQKSATSVLPAPRHNAGQSEVSSGNGYVAPERLNNDPEDFRSDIYSLGATLFHAIAGKPPIEASTNSATALSNQNNGHSIYDNGTGRFCRDCGGFAANDRS
jgi:serine/threonine protein kinase